MHLKVWIQQTLLVNNSTFADSDPGPTPVGYVAAESQQDAVAVVPGAFDTISLNRDCAEKLAFVPGYFDARWKTSNCDCDRDRDRDRNAPPASLSLSLALSPHTHTCTAIPATSSIFSTKIILSKGKGWITLLSTIYLHKLEGLLAHNHREFHNLYIVESTTRFLSRLQTRKGASLPALHSQLQLQLQLQLQSQLQLQFTYLASTLRCSPPTPLMCFLRLEKYYTHDTYLHSK